MAQRLLIHPFFIIFRRLWSLILRKIDELYQFLHDPRFYFYLSFLNFLLKLFRSSCDTLSVLIAVKLTEPN